ncbi:MAG: helix-turn-helix transcriptional regulator [Opitutales bacterium]|nr:helix-turn-helix transcriptional regulator [Opitutales bacterium]
MDYMLFIGKRLKDLRLQANLTQEQFSEQAGFNYKFYQNLESGRNKYIRLDTIERLAKSYNMQLWEFLKPPDDSYLKDCKKRIPGKPGRPKKNK